jgi:regulator of replication initiation timing
VPVLYKISGVTHFKVHPGHTSNFNPNLSMERSSARITEHKLSDLEKKLEILINMKDNLTWSVSELQRENAELRLSNIKLKEEAKETKKKYSTLEKDFNKSKSFAKIVSSKLTPTGGLAELKDSVERYIQEIDKCIEMLEDTL